MDPTPSELITHETGPTFPPESSSSFQLSFQVTMNLIFIALGVPSNVLAIFFLWRKCDGSLSPTMPFLLNLAAADLLVLTIFIPFYTVYEAMGFEWPFGSFLCKGVFSITHLCMYVSLATLSTIAVERYFITFHDSIRRRAVKYVIIAIWVVAIVLCIPQMIFLKTVNINSLEDFGDYSGEDFGEEESFLNDGEGVYEGEDKYVCEIVWPHPNVERILQPVDAVVLYLVPLAFVFVIYLKIILKLRAIDSKQLPPARMCFVKQRKRAIRKMIAIITIFAVCHLPIHVFHLMRVFFVELWEDLVIEYPWLFSLFVNLVLATHVVNPLIYGSLHHCFLCCMEFCKFFDCRYLFNPAMGGFSRSRKSNTQQTFLKNRPSSP